jgi:hypothetical protein
VNGWRERHAVRLQREVTRVEEADLSAREIALERLSSRGQEEWVVISPHCQERRRVISAALQRWIETATRPGVICRRQADAN